MSIKSYKPTTSSQRFLKQINYTNKFLKKKKLKSQSFGLTRSFGRNNQGHITSYHKGGGVKKVYRSLISYISTALIVEGLEYDPYRSAFIMRVYDFNKKIFYYQLAPEYIQKGDIVYFTSKNFYPKIGISFFLDQIPVGTFIHNIEFFKNSTHKCSVSAGTFSQVIQKTNKYCLVKLSSGQLRYFPNNSRCTFGKVSNGEHKFKVLGKAGRSRWLNKRPIVRGVAMNPIDHPHGGGQGKTAAGRPSVSPWGKLTKGKKTRNRKKVILTLK